MADWWSDTEKALHGAGSYYYYKRKQFQECKKQHLAELTLLKQDIKMAEDTMCLMKKQLAEKDAETAFLRKTLAKKLEELKDYLTWLRKSNEQYLDEIFNEEFSAKEVQK